MFERKKARAAMEAAINDIQMNLENNYKDLTIAARKTAGELLKQYKEKGVLKEADITGYQKRLSDYDEKLKKYGHVNISNFLKDEY